MMEAENDEKNKEIKDGGERPPESPAIPGTSEQGESDRMHLGVKKDESIPKPADQDDPLERELTGGDWKVNASESGTPPWRRHRNPCETAVDLLPFMPVSTTMAGSEQDDLFMQWAVHQGTDSLSKHRIMLVNTDRGLPRMLADRIVASVVASTVHSHGVKPLTYQVGDDPFGMKTLADSLACGMHKNSLVVIDDSNILGQPGELIRQLVQGAGGGQYFTEYVGTGGCQDDLHL